MKIAVWIGGIALVTGVALTTMLAGAAVGDSIDKVRSSYINIDAGEKTKLAAAITCVFPTADTSTIQKYWYSADELGDVYGTGVYEATNTAAQFVQDKAAGRVVQFLSAAGGNVTYDRKAPQKQLSGACETSHETFMDDVWSADFATITAAKCVRVTRGSGVIKCRKIEVITNTPAEHVAAQLDGSLVRQVGIVE